MKIFSNFKLRNFEMKNRIVMAPMCTNFGITSEKAIDYYTKRAKGGVGLIIIENTSASLFEDDIFVSKITQLSKSIHEHGSKVFMQLSVSPHTIANITRADINEIDLLNELTTSEIESCIKSLQRAAFKCYLSGYDGIEIHAAHGYFISSFFNSFKNRRSDVFGGNLEARMKFSLECISAIRSRVPDDFIISIRLSGSEIIPNGTQLNESIDLCKNLEAAGADIIHISAGVANTSDESVTPSKEAPFGVFSDYAATIKRHVSVPIISVGKNHNVEICESILHDNKADLIAVGRPLIADSNWLKKIKEDNINDINNCIYCNNCIRSISKGNYLNCTVNTIENRLTSS